MIAHNGEINTVKGNRNWMRARESQLASELIPGDLERLFPICTPAASDSASSTRCSSCSTSAAGRCRTRC
jgi:glutamate synthase (NADPH/NADH) large chain